MELFHFEFMQRAFLAGAFVGLVCSVVGVFVVLRGLAFIGAGISHSAFAGVAIGLLIGVPPLLSSLVFCSFVAVVLGFVSRVGRLREDTSIGIFFAASMALGVLLMSLTKGRNVDLLSYLFGSILTIGTGELLWCIGMSCLVILIIYLFYKELQSVIFDEELAELSGIPARAVAYLLLILVTLAIIASMKLVGIILVSALIVIPAATALQLARDFNQVVVIAGILGVVETEGGLVLSYFLDCAPGAMIVMVSTVVFILALGYRSLGGAVARSV